MFKINKLEKFTKYRFTIVYGIILTIFSIFVILDAIVIPKQEISVVHNESLLSSFELGNVCADENNYVDKNIEIHITYDRYYDSNIYIADIKLADFKLFRTAFAKDLFGRNIEDATSKIAMENDAILAINGDYYGFRDYGYILKNGIAYRSKARPEGKDDIMIMFDDGSVEFNHEREISMKSLSSNAENEEKRIQHIFSFGPILIDKNSIALNNEFEDLIVNPRTAFGIKEPLHYVFVCVDGRTNESRGITIEELTQYMISLGCEMAYNLDGGSSSSMYFNNRVVNKPSNGSERGVSDIVYIGY